MKILVVKTSALGDIIHAYPVISYLRSKFPEAAIDWVVEAGSADLVRSHPFIRRTLCVNTRSWRKGLFKSSMWTEIKNFYKTLRQESYDYVFDLQGNSKSGLFTLLAKGKTKVGFTFGTAPEWPNALATNKRFAPPEKRNVREDYLFLVQECFRDHAVPADSKITLMVSSEQKKTVRTLLAQPVLARKMPILVCPGSAWKNKRMTLESLSTMLKQFQKQFDCCFLILSGNQEERAFAESLKKQLDDEGVIVDRIALPALQYLMSAMRLVIAMDSLPLHLAGTAGVPTFAIFGPSLADKYKPMGEHQIAFQGTCPYGKTFEKRCPILRTCPTGSCIRGLTGEEAFAHFQKKSTPVNLELLGNEAKCSIQTDRTR